MKYLAINSWGGGALYKVTPQPTKKGGCCQPRIASSQAKGGVELNSIHRDRLW